MFDAKRLLDQLVGTGIAGGLAGGLAGGVLANALSGKKARKVAGSALQLGGLALVGGLAYKAWQNYQQGSGRTTRTGVATPPADSAFLPANSDTAGTGAGPAFDTEPAANISAAGSCSNSTWRCFTMQLQTLAKRNGLPMKSPNPASI
jgi:predicted lipid-binding transport protein (Tim44 family)